MRASVCVCVCFGGMQHKNACACSRTRNTMLMSCAENLQFVFIRIPESTTHISRQSCGETYDERNGTGKQMPAVCECVWNVCSSAAVAVRYKKPVFARHCGWNAQPHSSCDALSVRGTR